MTNAPTKMRAMEARKMIVATTRTGLNICERVNGYDMSTSLVISSATQVDRRARTYHFELFCELPDT